MPNLVTLRVTLIRRETIFQKVWRAPNCIKSTSKKFEFSKFNVFGREPWYSGYGRRLMFERSWVQILAPYTGWTWHWFIVKIVLFVWKDQKIIKIKKFDFFFGFQIFSGGRWHETFFEEKWKMTFLESKQCYTLKMISSEFVCNVEICVVFLYRIKLQRPNK